MKMIFTKEYIIQNCGCYSKDFDKYRLNALLSKLGDKVTLYQLFKYVPFEDFTWFILNKCEISEKEHIELANATVLYLFPHNMELTRVIKEYNLGQRNTLELITMGKKYNSLINQLLLDILKSKYSSKFTKYYWNAILDLSQERK